MGNPEPQIYFTQQPPKEPEIWEEAKEMAQQLGVLDALEKWSGFGSQHSHQTAHNRQ